MEVNVVDSTYECKLKRAVRIIPSISSQSISSLDHRGRGRPIRGRWLPVRLSVDVSSYIAIVLSHSAYQAEETDGNPTKAKLIKIPSLFQKARPGKSVFNVLVRDKALFLSSFSRWRA